MRTVSAVHPLLGGRHDGRWHRLWQYDRHYRTIQARTVVKDCRNASRDVDSASKAHRLDGHEWSGRGWRGQQATKDRQQWCGHTRCGYLGIVLFFCKLIFKDIFTSPPTYYFFHHFIFFERRYLFFATFPRLTNISLKMIFFLQKYDVYCKIFSFVIVSLTTSNVSLIIIFLNYHFRSVSVSFRTVSVSFRTEFENYRKTV